MDEILFMNYKPVNRQARRFLLQAKERPDPSYLYCLQLALWGLEHGGLAEDYRVEDSLRQMLGWNPEKVMRWLEREPADPDPQAGFSFPSDLKEPQELASAILVRLRELLTVPLGLNPLKPEFYPLRDERRRPPPEEDL